MSELSNTPIEIGKMSISAHDQLVAANGELPVGDKSLVDARATVAMLDALRA